MEKQKPKSKGASTKTPLLVTCQGVNNAETSSCSQSGGLDHHATEGRSMMLVDDGQPDDFQYHQLQYPSSHVNIEGSHLSQQEMESKSQADRAYDMSASLRIDSNGDIKKKPVRKQI